MFSLPTLEARLRERIAETPDLTDGRRRAAVAIVLHEARVLLMKRAIRAGDPWSGHISLPGGGFHVEDETLLRAAMRETHEELGVDLVGAKFLGQSPPLAPMMSGPLGVEVTPFVWVVDREPPLVLNHEAAGTFWLPLERTIAGAFDGEFDFEHEERRMKLPSWTYEGHVIWGLTWRLLSDVLILAKP